MVPLVTLISDGRRLNLSRDPQTRMFRATGRQPESIVAWFCRRVLRSLERGALFVVVRPWPIIAIVTSRPIVAIVRSQPIVTIVRSRPIVPIVRPRLMIATSGRVGGWFNHRTAWFAELCSISPQARHDSVRIGDLRAAQPPDVRRAGHLLFRGSPILLRKRRILRSDATTDRNRKAHENSMHSHAQSLFRYNFRTFDYFSSRFKINAA